MSETLADTAAQRLAGGRPSRARSLLAAAVAGFAVGAATYKLLRSSGS